MLSQQIIQIKKKLSVNEKQEGFLSVESMMDYASIYGIGRWANSTEIYEGQFNKNGEYHGTGRRILSDMTV